MIGAGAAGLVAARELLREGHRVSVFEKSPIVGGVWVYTDEVEDDPLGVAPGRGGTSRQGRAYEPVQGVLLLLVRSASDKAVVRLNGGPKRLVAMSDSRVRCVFGACTECLDCNT